MQVLIIMPPYDPLRDFQPITFAVHSPLVLVVNAAVPVKAVKDLIARAKANPQGLNYASGRDQCIAIVAVAGNPGHGSGIAWL